MRPHAFRRDTLSVDSRWKPNPATPGLRQQYGGRAKPRILTSSSGTDACRRVSGLWYPEVLRRGLVRSFAGMRRSGRAGPGKAPRRLATCPTWLLFQERAQRGRELAQVGRSHLGRESGDQARIFERAGAFRTKQQLRNLIALSLFGASFINVMPTRRVQPEPEWSLRFVECKAWQNHYRVLPVPRRPSPNRTC